MRADGGVSASGNAQLPVTLATGIDRTIAIRTGTVTISPKFQIVIPQKVRDNLGLRSGEKAHVLASRDRIEVIPVRNIPSLRGYLKGINTEFERDQNRA